MNKFLDSCGHYNTAQISGKYDLIQNNAGFPKVSGVGARSSSQALIYGTAAFTGITLPNYKTYMVGWAMSLPVGGGGIGANGFSLCVFRDIAGGFSDASIQTGFTLRADGTIRSYKSTLSTIADSAAGAYPLTQGVIHYIEFQVTVHSTTGAILCRVDGVPILNVTGQNTQATTNPYANQIVIGDFPSIGTGFTACDIYMNDDQGTLNNALEGDSGVYLLSMNTQGAFAQWTASGAGSNVAAVSENPASDTKYVFDSTPGDRDTYLPGTIPATNQPQSIQLVTRAEKDSASARSLQQNVRSGGVDSFSPTATLGVGFSFLKMIQETDPATGNQWASVTAVQNAEYGQKLIT